MNEIESTEIAVVPSKHADKREVVANAALAAVVTVAVTTLANIAVASMLQKINDRQARKHAEIIQEKTA